MRLPDFCAQDQRSHALLLSYTLDPVFFETVALRRLEIGGAQRVLVLADAHEALGRTAEAAAELRQIGRTWSLGTVRLKGSFHPKLVARFGRNDASVALLSGNITPSGWGRNLEVGSHWLVGPGHGDRGAWLAGLLDTCAGWSLGTAQRAVLDEIRDFAWLRGAAEQTPKRSGPRSAVLAEGNTSLFSHIRQRWAGRRFERARISTGSTDADGAFVRQLVSTFGVEKVSVYVNSDRHSFVADKVDNLPLTLRSPPTDRPLHAKVVWLSGPEGHVAAWGSPNCSRSAWLLPESQGGNVELAMVDDDPDVAALQRLFAALRGGKKLKALDRERPSTRKDGDAKPLELTEVNVDAVGRWVVRVLTSPGTVLEAAHLRITRGDREIGRVRLTAQADGFVGIAPDLRGHGAMFARLVGTIGAKSAETLPFPVNQSALLLRAHIDPDKAKLLGLISAETTSFTDRNAILQELFDLAWSEYTETDTNAASEFRARARHKQPSGGSADASAEDDTGSEAGEIALLDPLELVRRAASGEHPSRRGEHGQVSGDLLSIFERLIWAGTNGHGTSTRDSFEADAPGADGSGWDGAEWDYDAQDTQQSGLPRDAVAGGSPLHRDQVAEDAETAAAYKERIEGWIMRLGNVTMLNAEDAPCTAYRAAVFIIAASQSFRQARWIPARDATDYIVRTAQCFLRVGKTPGLLAELGTRCFEGHQFESFRKHLANGRLLTSFVRVLTEGEPESLAEAVQRASMLDRLRADPTFVSQFDASGLEALFASAPDPAGQMEGIIRARAIADASARLDAVMQGQSGQFRRRIGRGTQMTPDLFWSEAEGWTPDRGHRAVNTLGIGWKAASRDVGVLRAAEAVMAAFSAGG